MNTNNKNTLLDKQDKVFATVKKATGKRCSYDPHENKGSVLFTADSRDSKGRMFCWSMCDRITAAMQSKMNKTAAALRKCGMVYVRVSKITWDGNTYFGEVLFKSGKEM